MQKIITTITIILLSITIVYVFAGVVFHPLQSIDAIGIWLLKTKAFYLEHGFPNSYLHTSLYAYSHQQYPLGLPFLFFLIYQFLGGIHEKVILLIYPCVYTLILFFVYKVLKRETKSTNALLFTYIYSMLSPFIAGGGRILAGNADIFLVLLEWLIIFILYKRKLRNTYYILIAFLVMLASQVKLEGVFMVALLLFLPVKLKLFLVSISIVPFIIWSSVVYYFKIPADSHMIFLPVTLLLERVGIILAGILRELFNVNNWYLFWPLVVAAVFLKQKISDQLKIIFLPAYAVMMFFYILVFLFSSIETYDYVRSSFDRVLFQHSAIIFLFFFEKTNRTIAQFLSGIISRGNTALYHVMIRLRPVVKSTRG